MHDIGAEYKTWRLLPEMRAFMGGFPSGVAVVTALDGPVPRGLTCSSVTRVMLRPPIIVVSLRNASPVLHAAIAGSSLTVNCLREEASAVADLFASGIPDRFERVTWRLPDGAAGPHLITDSYAIADCAIVRTVDFGECSAVFAEVRRVLAHSQAEPLLYGRRRYARWSDAVRPALAGTAVVRSPGRCAFNRVPRAVARAGRPARAAVRRSAGGALAPW